LYEKLTSSLLSINFTQSKDGSSLFIRNTKSSFIILLIYVDDIILARNCMSDIKDVKTSLDTTFKI